MDRGEIWRVTLPPQNGREQAGERPAVIFQDEAYTSGSPLVLVVALASQLSALRFRGTVRVDAGPETGLTADSVALVFQLRAVDRKRLTTRIGRLTSGTLRLLLDELDRLTGNEDPFADE